MKAVIDYKELENFLSYLEDKILVLQFAVPVLHHPQSISELANALISLLPKLASWFISIVIKGV